MAGCRMRQLRPTLTASGVAQLRMLKGSTRRRRSKPSCSSGQQKGKGGQNVLLTVAPVHSTAKQQWDESSASTIVQHAAAAAVCSMHQAAAVSESAAAPWPPTLTAASARCMFATTSSLRLVSCPSWYCRWALNSWADTYGQAGGWAGQGSAGQPARRSHMTAGQGVVP